MKVKIYIIAANEKNKEPEYHFRNSAEEAESCARSIFYNMRVRSGIGENGWKSDDNILIRKDYNGDLISGFVWQIINGTGSAYAIKSGEIYGKITVTQHEAEVPNRFEIETPEGILEVYDNPDGDYPGVFVDIKQDKNSPSLPLALVEYTETEYDFDSGKIISRIWGDSSKEDYTTRIVHDIDFHEEEEEEKLW